VSVTVEPSGIEVARLGPGEFFGEMTLLTGEPRSATVTAVSDSQLIEITVEAFRRFVLDNPAVLEQVSAAVAERTVRLEEHRTAGSPAPAVHETPQSFLARVRRFLRVGTN
jgi:CRP-like cAMP-binding protein